MCGERTLWYHDLCSISLASVSNSSTITAQLGNQSGNPGHTSSSNANNWSFCPNTLWSRFFASSIIAWYSLSFSLSSNAIPYILVIIGFPSLACRYAPATLSSLNDFGSISLVVSQCPHSHRSMNVINFHFILGSFLLK